MQELKTAVLRAPSTAECAIFCPSLYYSFEKAGFVCGYTDAI